MSRFFFFLLALFSASSQAFTTLDPYMVPAEIRQVSGFVSVDGDTVKVNAIGKGFGANQPYFTKVVSIPKAKFLSWLRANLKNLIKINPWWIAFTALMAVAGWAFDELLAQYTQLLTSPVGKCFSGSYMGTGYLYGSGMTVKECATAVMPAGSTYRSYSYAGGPNPPLINQKTGFYVNYVNTSGTNNSDAFYVVPTLNKTEISPVADETLLDNVFAEMMKNPEAAAQAMTAPGGYPYDDLFKDANLKYIPGVSEADYPALDCYFRGALQTSNAAGACYATETEYQRIKKIAEQIKAAATPGGAADALNDKLKDPLTQAQLEESLNKLSDADVSGVTTDAADIYDEGYKQLSDSIVGNTLPGMPDISPLPQFETGSCRSITLNFSLAGQHITKEFPGKTGCEQFEKLKEFMGWLLAMGVIFTLTFTALREAN